MRRFEFCPSWVVIRRLVLLPLVVIVGARQALTATERAVRINLTFNLGRDRHGFQLQPVVGESGVVLRTP